jgi:hypothetical protein
MSFIYHHNRRSLDTFAGGLVDSRILDYGKIKQKFRWLFAYGSCGVTIDAQIWQLYGEI